MSDYGEEGRRCDWPGCRETTQNPTEGGWWLGSVDEECRKYLPKGLPLKLYCAACPLHAQMIKACWETVVADDA